MGKAIISHNHKALRDRRLGYFCKEVKRAITLRCLDDGYPLRNVDFYVEEFFTCLARHECEYSVEILVALLHEEDFITNAYRGYLENIGFA